MNKFELVSDYTPQGDQPEAIKKLIAGVEQNQRFQTLLGVTGSGKTFTVANVIQHFNRPTLVMSPNKTLAAQLYSEFTHYFPNNAVEFFISYYDYYQPEAYIPHSDVYIEKQTEINEEIDKLRLRATSSLFERSDVIIVASVSSIYGLGSPSEYRSQLLFMELGQEIVRRDLLNRLIDIQYNRNDFDLVRGSFRARGDVIEIHPAYDDFGLRIELEWDKIAKITRINMLTGEVLADLNRAAVYPSKHFVTSPDQVKVAIESIKEELTYRTVELRSEGKLLECQRIDQRTRFDIEMLTETGYCSGVENYSRYFTGKKPGEPPWTLFDYFPDDFLLIVDESHVAIPQIKGMIGGDRSRKQVLVEHGFRLPSALDNRPLTLEEWESKIVNAICVSATPADFEVEKSDGVVVEQIIRPTGLLDPPITIKPSGGQIDDLIEEIRLVVSNNERVLVTALTKRMAEDLTEYLCQAGIRARYLHSDIASLDRVAILQGLRLAEFDVLVGINLLREGLDLPEVSLVAVLDADKEGFLRSTRSLMQVAGRAARNSEGKVIYYADKMTPSMKAVISETERRREVQIEHNRKHGLTPKTIIKNINSSFSTTTEEREKDRMTDISKIKFNNKDEYREIVKKLTAEMLSAAKSLKFEQAAIIRDKLTELKDSFKRNG